MLDLDRIKEGAISAHAAGRLDRWALRDIVDLVNEVRAFRQNYEQLSVRYVDHVSDLQLALSEACDVACAQNSFHPEEADRIAKLREIAGEPRK